MRTSLRGRQFVAQREACVLVPYEDGMSGGAIRYSIGFGGLSSKDAPPISVEAAWNILGETLKEYEQYVNRHLGGTTLTQQAFDALVSLYYNTGPGGNKQALIALIKAGDVIAAADLLRTFNKNQGKVSAGHTKRRQQERDVFLRGRYGDLSSILVWHGDPKTTPFERIPMPT